MPPLTFRKELVADEPYEAVAIFDVDNDGVLDIVSGAYWYPGPDFERKCFRGPVLSYGEYFDDFCAIPLDVDGDGYLDVVSGSAFNQTLRWHRNPRGDKNALWEVHEFAKPGFIETARGWDIDGDGILEIIPNTPNGPQLVYKLETDLQGRGLSMFTEHVIWSGTDERPTSGHGIGCGDIAGNGRADIVLSHGWLEAPSDPYGEEWRYHPEFDLGLASIPILVVDINDDGVNELIVGNAHGYGLAWWEQGYEAGRRKWIRHEIDPCCAQYHDLIWADIDGDGDAELITGKRYRGHNGHDVGEYDPLGIYYFKWTGETFAKQVIDYGPIGTGSGCGVSFAVADLDDNGLLDVVAPGKDGLHLFRNRGFTAGRGDRPGFRAVSDLERTRVEFEERGSVLVAELMPFGRTGPRYAYFTAADSPAGPIRHEVVLPPEGRWVPGSDAPPENDAGR